MRAVRYGRTALLVCVAALALSGTAAAADTAPDTAAEAGARLYESGLDLGGRPIIAVRQGGAQLAGQDAACTNCHRRSGLGTFEGSLRIPPVAWRLLSRSGAQIAADRALPHVLGFNTTRPAYTAATLVRALRDGIGADGRALSWIMPRYRLADADIRALQAHLAQLEADPPEGAVSGQLLFSLVLTPGLDAATEAAVVAVFEQTFADHNAELGGTGNGGGGSAGYDVLRHWQLDVWRLQGPAQAWPAQLERRRAEHPPFALVGGAGGGDWSVIGDFCESHRLPLILPAADAPPVQPHAFYGIYFHRGVSLEAGLVAHELGARPGPPLRVTQVYRAGDAGEVAARALRTDLGPQWPLSDVVLPAAPMPPDRAFDRLPADESQLRVFWLRPADLAALPAAARRAPAYVSGVMASDHLGWTSGWAEMPLLTYPWETPARRRIAMNFPAGWFRAKGQPNLSAHAQTDAWLAAQVLTQALADMLDAYYPEYLVERVESLLGHRLTNAHYPHLSLAPGQRFASKGGYLMQVEPDGSLVPEGPWTIP